jgi:hypothetical protein
VRVSFCPKVIDVQVIHVAERADEVDIVYAGVTIRMKELTREDR